LIQIGSILPSPTLTLRPFCASDAQYFASLAADERVVRYIGFGQPWSQSDIDSCIEAALKGDALDTVGSSRWYVATEATQSVGILFSTRQEDSVEIGYWVTPAHWGRGVATAILDLALASVPKLFQLDKLTAGVAPANTLSARLLTNRGFTLESHSDELEQYVLNQRSS